MNSHKQMKKTNRFLYLFTFLLIISATSFAQQPITAYTSTTQAATASSYMAGGNMYNWGTTVDEILTSVTWNGNVYDIVPCASEMVFWRVDNGISTGTRCRIFAEYTAPYTYEATYPTDAMGDCSMETALVEPYINRGALDVFHNVNAGTELANNIERADIFFASPFYAPDAALLGEGGFIATEKSGNNEFNAALILGVDGSGEPSNYSGIAMIDGTTADYGRLPPNRPYSFLQNLPNPPHGLPQEYTTTSEPIGFTLILFQDFGLTGGEQIYGISFFGQDVTGAAGQDLTDPTTFPDDTNEGADIHGCLGCIAFTDELPNPLVDWGDLPDGPYPTLLANNGPRHLLDGETFFGTSADAEADGQPTLNADGDDNTDDDDEDGWTPPTSLVVTPGGTFDTNINVTAPVGQFVYISAWIDWDLNGVFDAGESAFTTTTGTGSTESVAITFNIPADNPVFSSNDLKNVYARFRLSSDPGPIAAPTGEAPDGEVEDYLIADVALPVELSLFTANATMSGVQLDWRTESEIENLGFTLERKTTDDDFVEIASYKTNDDMLGQGTTSSANDYTYTDNLVEANTTYEYRLADVDYNGVVTYHSTREVTVEQAPLAKIEEFTVLPAYPNPFNPNTTIRYNIPNVIESEARQSLVSIQIYDITGNLISTLLNREQTPGWHSITWNGTNQHGEYVPAGIYFASISTEGHINTLKLMFMK